MNKVVASSISKVDIKNLISISEFKHLRQRNEPILTVEIQKQPTILIKDSLWIGYRNGGMASWLSIFLSHLPHNKFCLFMNADSYQGSQYVYSYYTQYFQKLFHKEFVGTCIYPKKLIEANEISQVNEIKAKQLRSHLINSRNLNQPIVLLDFRGVEAASKCSINNAIKQYKNTSYINIPLNDEDFIELLNIKTRHLSDNTQFITMCAKGYRSIIGYSLLNLMKMKEWKIKVCRCSQTQIQQQLNKVQQVQSKVKRSFSMLFSI